MLPSGMPKPLPAPALAQVLTDALRPCPAFEGTCKGVMRWVPERGHVPRGFVGAFGALDQVELVIVTAEPGEPLPRESQDILGLQPEERVRAVCQFTYDQLVGSTGRARDYHDNILLILDLIWPGLPLDTKLTKAWVTESVLCSARRSGGAVPQAIEAACRKEYLDRQLNLLRGVPVLALGGKAQSRLLGTDYVSAYHPSAAHGRRQKEEARRSWEDAAERVRAAIQKRPKPSVAETVVIDVGQLSPGSAPSEPVRGGG